MAAKKTVSKKTATKKTASKKTVAKKATRKRTVTPERLSLTTVGAFADSLVPVTYELTKSNDVEIRRLFIGDTKIELEVDQDPADPNRFFTRGSKKYMCINDDEGLKVVLRADGQMGGNWSLTITRAGTALADNPIEKDVDHIGHADHNAFQN